MGIKLGLVGLGAFGSGFVPLFANHPLVDSVILCGKFEITNVFPETGNNNKQKRKKVEMKKLRRQ